LQSRRFIVAALAGTLALSTFGSAAAEGHHGGFKDLGRAKWAAPAIDMLAQQGLLNGVTPTTFAPQKPITIGQLAAVLLRFQGHSKAGESFGAEVEQASRAGMMSGLGGQVGSGEAATRAQAMAMIVNALGLQGQTQFGNLANFRDQDKVPGWARHSLALAVGLGLLEGSQGNLMPDVTITRAQLAVILQRIELLLGLGQASSVSGTFVGTGTTTVNGQAAQTITIQPYSASSGSQSQATYTIAANAEIDYGSQSGSLSSFKAGDQVMLTLDQTGDASVIVDLQGASTQQAHAGSVSGTVTAIGNGQITIQASQGQGDDQGEDDRGSLPSGTYTLSPAVKVVIPGEGAHGSVSQVAVGAFVRLVVGPSGLVDMILVHPSQGEGGGSTSTAPTGVTASEAATGVALNWTGVSGATSYQVLEASGGAYAPVPAANGGTPAGTGTTVTGLAAGTSYTFEVEAVTPNGTSQPSAASSSVEWGARSSGTATVSVTTSGGNSYATIAVGYDKPLAPASLDTAATDYTVIDTTTGLALAVQSVSANASTVSIVTQPTTIATLGSDNITVTTAKSVVNDLAGAPTTPIDASSQQTLTSPTNVSAQETATGIALSWTGVTGATSYEVLASNGGAYAPVAAASGGTPNGATTTVTGLSAGTSYTFEVEAVSSNAISAPSSATSAVEWGAKAGASASVAATMSGGTAYVTIGIPYDKTLNPSSVDTATGDYTVTDATTGQSLGVQSVSANGSTLTIVTQPASIASLATDTIAVKTAKSVVNDAAGAPTTPIQASGAASLAVPGNLAAQETSSGIALTFTPVAGATSYQVLESSGGAYAPLASANGGTPTGNGTTVTGLSAGTSYTFEVEAVGAPGTSMPSTPSVAVEWGATASPNLGTAATVTSGQETLTITVTYDKTLNAASLDTTPSDYTVTDTTTNQSLGVASVTVNGQTVVITTVAGTPLTSTDALRVTTAKSVVDDTAGAPTTAINATGTV
jgi:hypothetical protein